MTDTEKMTIARLLFAIDEANKPIPFTLSLPPAFGEWDRKTADVALERKARESVLAGAIAETKAMIGLA